MTSPARSSAPDPPRATLATMPNPPFHEGTRVVQAGLPEAEQGTPFLPGPTLAAPYHLTGDPSDSDYVYGRYSNPSWSRYEAALGELEGGAATLFASGMAAVTATLLPRLRPGETLLAPADCYQGVRRLAGSYFPQRGVDLRELIERAHRAGARVAVDNTFATPLGQRPLELGADFSIASASKQLTGHADLIMG